MVVHSREAPRPDVAIPGDQHPKYRAEKFLHCPGSTDHVAAVGRTAGQAFLDACPVRSHFVMHLTDVAFGIVHALAAQHHGRVAESFEGAC